jgi:hypothetical protein
VGEEDSTAVAAEGFMQVAAEGFTQVAAEGFAQVAAEGFTGVAVSTPEATLGTAAGTTTADMVAATTEVGALMAGAVEAGATAGAEDIGAEDTVTDGVGDGDLASGGRIGVGDIRMATTARGITRPTLIILTRTIRILTTGTTILHRQIQTHDPTPTRTDPQDTGDPLRREAQPTRTMQTATSRPLRLVGRFSQLTG